MHRQPCATRDKGIFAAQAEGQASPARGTAATTPRAPGRRALLATLAGCAGLLSRPAVSTETTGDTDDIEDVDVLLVLAVDVSCSISEPEMRLQRDGYGAALCHDDVLDAIRSGPCGAIGLAYLQWAGLEYQRLIVPWTRIGDRDDTLAWSARMERAAVAAQGEAEAAAFPNGSMTSISSGIRLAVSVLESAPWTAARRVIDISGDGPNNDGPPVETARDIALARGITINGLAIEGDPGIARELGPGTSLEDYYREAVIGGPGAFVVPVPGAAAFGSAIRRKMMREIAGIGIPGRATG